MRALFLVIAVFFALSSYAKKHNYSFEMLIAKADVIVTGQISTLVTDEYYSFTVDQWIKGEGKKEIVVKVFSNWACDMRWKKPEPGQKLFLFLEKKEDGYEIINGSDGEIFIVENKLRLYNIYNWGISQYFKEVDSPDLNDVILAVKNFNACYSLIIVKDSPWTFRQIKKDDEIYLLRSVNSFSTWLFDRLKGYSNILKNETARNGKLSAAVV